ncbi:MAG TPA: NAD(P)H-dependent oxidoreductase subunit E [Thermodesulfovibrionales bacterium]|nr:NAD(P)H-dependent oxidoreductase subunit E [Thermodesulfovibrionales bacterium]
MGRDMRILFVDDEPIITRSAERVLNAEGYVVDGVLSGREATSRMEQDHYDLLVTDLRMPEMDGLTLIRRTREYRPSMGIVVITGYPSQETMKEVLDLGIIDYVPKPFTPDVLIDVTRRATEWIGRTTAGQETGEEFPPSMLAELDKVIDQYKGKPGGAIPVLQRAQEIVGYLPPVIQKRIARGLNIYPAEIHSIVSFYSFFTMKPRGDHTIKVCLGTACYVKGIEPVLHKIKDALQIEVGETTKDRKFTLEAVRCVGACGLAPVMLVDQDTHGVLTQGKAMDAINHYSPVSLAAPAEGFEAVAEKEG